MHYPITVISLGLQSSNRLVKRIPKVMKGDLSELCCFRDEQIHFGDGGSKMGMEGDSSPKTDLLIVSFSSRAGTQVLD